jgi:hypothetical protein
VRHTIGGETLSKLLSTFITDVNKTEIKPRYQFKRKFRTVEGQEHFDVQPVAVTNVDPTYHAWSKA